jgi:hypothetical protein
VIRRNARVATDLDRHSSDGRLIRGSWNSSRLTGEGEGSRVSATPRNGGWEVGTLAPILDPPISAEAHRGGNADSHVPAASWTANFPDSGSSIRTGPVVVKAVPRIEVIV